ncbi:hypothetical protein, partial [Thalassospira lucentensis]
MSDGALGGNATPSVARDIAQKPVLTHSVVQDDAVQVLVRESINALEAQNMDEASRLINLALKLDITNPDLQFLNGLTYHLMGV